MKLLTKKEVKSNINSKENENIKRRILLEEECNAKIKELNDIKDKVKADKEKIDNDFSEYVKEYTERKSKLNGELAILEEKKKRLLEPVDNMLLEAEMNKRRSQEKLDIIITKETELSEKEDKIKEDLIFIDNEKNKINSRKEKVSELEDKISEELKIANDKTISLAKDYEEFDKLKATKIKELEEAERTVNDKEKANNIIAIQLKEKQEIIDKDRKHLESQIETFKLAKNEYSRKTKN